MTELHEEFCFICACKRCLWIAPLPHEHHVSSGPALFMNAMTPAGLPEEALAEEVGRRMSLIRITLVELKEPGQESSVYMIQQ